MERRIKLLMPTMPNFIRIEQLTAKREQGYKELPTIPVSDLAKKKLRNTLRK